MFHYKVKAERYVQKVYVIHITCNRLIIGYLVQQTAQSVINNNLSLLPFLLLFDFYRDVNRKAHKYIKFRLELKHSILN
jgi:hypothetical protein